MVGSAVIAITDHPPYGLRQVRRRFGFPPMRWNSPGTPIGRELNLRVMARGPTRKGEDGGRRPQDRGLPFRRDRAARRGPSRSSSPTSRARRASGRSTPTRCSGALARHDEILRDAIAAHDGHVVKTTGDGSTPRSPTAERRAARRGRRAASRSARAAWGDTGPLRVRMGMHTGAARAARRRLLRHRGQPRRAADGGRRTAGRSWCRSPPRSCVRDDSPDGVELVDLGEHRLRDLARAGAGVPARSARPPARLPAAAIARRVPAATSRCRLTSFVGREARARRDRRGARATSSARHAHRRRRSRQDPARAPGRRARCCRDFPRRRVVLRARRGRATPTRWSQVVAATLGVHAAPGHDARRRASLEFLGPSSCSSCSTTASTCSTPPVALADSDPPRAARACASLATSREGLGGRGRAGRGRCARSPCRDADRRLDDAIARATRCGCSSTGRARRDAGFALDAGERRRGRRDLPPARRHPARDRARGGARRRR